MSKTFEMVVLWVEFTYILTMNYRTLYAALALTFAMIGGGCSRQASEEAGQDNLTQYVDPYIGTGDHGHVFLGANIPFGLVQLGTYTTQSWMGLVLGLS